MKYVNLALALHHHQPVGNLPHILEECYQKCYLPILDAVERYPRLKFNLSYSGPLLRFFEQQHPEFLEKLKWLIACRQVELLATGFYEPILAEIEEDDRQGQLRLMIEWMDENLGVTPKGAWLSEGVWENSLAKTFRHAGLSYTIVRNERLLQAGVAESQLHGYHVTEYFGNVLRLFPRDPNLYRLIPYGEPDELMVYLRRMANRGLGLTLTFDDFAERWGVWPGSFERIQQSGTMEKLFAALNDAGDWLQLRTFSEVINDEPPQGRCYIPAGPSAELGMWSLPDESRQRFAWALGNIQQRHDANRFLPFFRAGSWGGFRARYFESNLMEKKGLWLKSHLSSLASEEKRRQAQDLLWQAQCNTAYWHGTSGGIYLPHLRQAIWDRLLAAQQIILQGDDEWKAEKHDFTADDQDDVLAYNNKLSFFVDPAYGGACFEFSLLDDKWNFANTLTRRPETDPSLAGDTGGTKNSAVPVDNYKRHLFQERFVNRHVTTEELRQGQFREGGDFIGTAYKFIGVTKRDGGLEIELERLGNYLANGVSQPVRLIKTYFWNREATEMTLRYKIKNESALPVNSCFATELNLCTVPSQDANGEVLVAGGKARSFEYAWYEDLTKEMQLRLSPGLGLSLATAEPASVWSYPINSQGEADGQAPLIRQGNCFLVGWPLTLRPGDDASFELKVRLDGV
jgi:alpha-amylase